MFDAAQRDVERLAANGSDERAVNHGDPRRCRPVRLVHAHDRQVLGGDALVTQMPGHLLAQADRPAVTACALAAADAAR